jgi:hypothetical protein
LHDGTQHTKTRRKFLDNGIPILFSECPQCANSLGMIAETISIWQRELGYPESGM